MAHLKTPALLVLMALAGSRHARSWALDVPSCAAYLDWSWGPALPHITAGAACCATPQGVISIGGAYWGGLDTGRANKVWLSEVYRLDSSAGRWTTGPSYPMAVSHALAVVVGDEAVVIGGRDSTQAYDTTWRLNLTEAASVWRTAPALPRAAFALGGGVVGSTIYVVTDAHATIDGKFDSAHPPEVLAWDVTDRDGAWSQVATIPDSDVGFRTVAVVGRRLVILGGAVSCGDGLRLVDAIDVLDLDTLKWRRGPRLATPLRDASAVAIDERRLILTGGVEDAGLQTQDAATPAIILTNRCWIYDVEAEQLDLADSLRLAVADHGLAATNDRLYVVAGEDSPYRTRTAQVQVAALQNLRAAATTSARETVRARPAW